MKYKRIFEDLPKELGYGKELFGDFLGGYKDKDDTKKERDLIDNIKSWIKGDLMGKKQKDGILKDLKKLQKLKQYAPEILEPTTNILYRGVKKTFKQLNMTVKKEDFKFDNSIKFWITDKIFNYKPHNKLQSWAVELIPLKNSLEKIAKIKGKELSSEKSYYIIFKAEFPKEELFFNHQFLNKIDKYFSITPENEVVHVGNSQIKVKLLLSEIDYEIVFGK